MRADNSKPRMTELSKGLIDSEEGKTFYEPRHDPQTSDGGKYPIYLD